MLFILVTLLLYCAPIVIGTFLLYWLLQRFGISKTSHALVEDLFVGLGIFLCIALIYDWTSRHHHLNFYLGKFYHIELSATETETWLNSQVDYEVEIKNQETGQRNTFNFGSYSDSELAFVASETNPHRIEIIDMNHNSQYWIISMDKKQIRSQIITKNNSAPEKADTILVSNYQVVKLNK